MSVRRPPYGVDGVTPLATSIAALAAKSAGHGFRGQGGVTMVTIVFLWFAFTFVVAVFANTRGRSAIGWWILAVIVSPLVAGLFLLAMRNLRMERLLLDPVVLAEET